MQVYRRPAPSKQDTEDYAQSIKTIGSFDTVNQFWAFYSHLVRPTDLQGILHHPTPNSIRTMMLSWDLKHFQASRFGYLEYEFSKVTKLSRSLAVVLWHNVLHQKIE